MSKLDWTSLQWVARVDSEGVAKPEARDEVVGEGEEGAEGLKVFLLMLDRQYSWTEASPIHLKLTCLREGEVKVEVCLV